MSNVLEPPQTQLPPPERLMSLDAYRGFTMLLMAMQSWRWIGIAKKFPDSTVWPLVAHQFEHLPWVGCTIWDMIQPSFMFMVGVSMVYSLARRQAQGQSWPAMLGHAAWRAVVLVLLGVFLRSQRFLGFHWTFEDVLTQIGLGYVFLFLLWDRSWRVQIGALVCILVGYWALFALWPLPPEDHDPAAHGVPQALISTRLEGFEAHWNINANPAHYFDRWLLNRFPRPDKTSTEPGTPVERGKPFVGNSGGYQTLNFIPALGTMILGLLAGRVMREARSPARRLAVLIAVGLGLLAVGLAIGQAGVCPIVKRIWTPSWTLFSGGWCFLLLATFYAIIDVAGWRRWAFVGVVAGLNPITLYVMSGLLSNWVLENLKRILGQDFFNNVAGDYAALAEQVATVSVLWLVCYAMYRRRWFVRI